MSATRAAGERQDLWRRLPDAVDRRVRVFGWLSFLAQTVIVGTGGAVRLTSSGLGCNTWPTCTADSLVPTPEQGFHGLIEFGNRMMTGVVGIIALIVLILVWRLRYTRRDLFVLAWVVMGGILAQAVVGGVSVLTGLNQWIVGFHYFASLLLVCATAAFVVRAYATPGPRRLAVPRWFATLTHITSVVLVITVAVGVTTTGAGPHSGDDSVRRSGFDASFLAHVHSWPAYALFGLSLVLLIAAWMMRLPVRGWLTALVGLEIVQIAVGLLQSRSELPPLLVGTHMVLAALTAAAMTVVILNLKEPAAVEA